MSVPGGLTRESLERFPLGPALFAIFARLGRHVEGARGNSIFR